MLNPHPIYSYLDCYMHKVKLHPYSVPVLRVMLSGIFLMAGASHLISADQTLQRLENTRLGEYARYFRNPEFLVYASGGVMFVAGLLFIAGIKTRLTAGILALVLIPITLTIQVGQVSSIGPLFKNIAILGGLLFFILNDFQRLKDNNK